MECKFCKKILSTKSALSIHQKKASYCLKIQGVETQSEKNTLKTLKEELVILRKDIEVLREDKKNLQDKCDNFTVSKNCDNTRDVDAQEYSLTNLELGEGFTIEQRKEDGYINVTNLCKAGKKQFQRWKELEKTKAFIEVLSHSIAIPADLLMKIEKGTWAHPQVAINIAQWISPQFDVKVSNWIYKIMMNVKVNIKSTTSLKELQTENIQHQIKIQYLTKKYVKAQPRMQYDAKNVIYIVTTKLMKQERRYIMGKAINLTNRLSTYNKSDEHEVVYYEQCSSEETMSLVENMVFLYLKNCREQANRERFLLPEDQDITYFSDIVKKSIEFFN